MNLKGKKVTLRAIEPTDLEFLRSMMNDEAISDGVIGLSFPVSSAMQEKWYQSILQDHDNYRFIIETEKDGAVGLVTMGDIDWVNRVVHSTGIKVDSKKITESGIALDAMTTMFKFIFYQLNLNRIEGTVLIDNVQANALNKLLGYTIEGTLRQAIYRNGKYHDVYFLGMLKEDFDKRHLKKKDTVQ